MLAAVTQSMVSNEEDILANLWELHSEALCDIMNITLDYDILALPPPIVEEPPQWYINFLNSDREPAKSPTRPAREPTPEPPVDLPAIDNKLPELPALSPPPPEPSWEDYLAIAGLEEVEPLSDVDSLPQTPSSQPSRCWCSGCWCCGCWCCGYWFCGCWCCGFWCFGRI